MPDRVSPDQMPDTDVLYVLYDDIFISGLEQFFVEGYAKTDEISPRDDSSIPDEYKQHLTGGNKPIAAETSTTQNELKQKFKNLSDKGKHKKFWIQVEEEWGAGSGADWWTTDQAANEAGISTNTVRGYRNNKLEDIIESHPDDDKYRLTESRFANPELKADGGHDWSHDWDLDREVSWNRTTDWFSTRNVPSIQQIWEHTSEIDRLMIKMCETRENLEEQIQFGGEYPTIREDYTEQLNELISDVYDEISETIRVMRELTINAYTSLSAWIETEFDRSQEIDEGWLPKNRRDPPKQKLGAIQWAILNSHLDPILNRKLEPQARDDGFPNQLYIAEKQIRSFLEVLWQFRRYLFEERGEVTQTEEEPEQDETDNPAIGQTDEHETDNPAIGQEDTSQQPDESQQPIGQEPDIREREEEEVFGVIGRSQLFDNKTDDILETFKIVYKNRGDRVDIGDVQRKLGMPSKLVEDNLDELNDMGLVEHDPAKDQFWVPY